MAANLSPMTAIVPKILASVTDPEAGPRALKESWRYTNLHALADKQYTQAQSVELDAETLPALAVPGSTLRLVFVNGYFDKRLSHALPDSGALRFDGASLSLAAETALRETLELVFVTASESETETVRAPKLDCVFGANSFVAIVERHISCGESEAALLTTPALSFRLERGARVTHLRLQESARTDLHFARTCVSLMGAADFRSFALIAGAAHSRYEVAVELLGTGGQGRINGLYLLNGAQRAEIVTTVAHKTPNGESDQCFRGIVAGKAKAAFLGKIAVARDAQKTNAYQSHKALPLSPDAEINAKPELEILADDVKCSHGVAIGALDPVTLFYLRSRGISLADARRLLVEAFAAESLDFIGDPALSALARSAVQHWLAAVAKEQ